MNPFAVTTNPSLFNWTKDYDQLIGKETELQIRVQMDYYPYVEDYIEYILEVNKCVEEKNSSEDHPGSKPYFIFLDEMKKQLS